MNDIRYPFALNETGDAVSIKEARKGDLFHCLGCDQVMVAKKGRLRVWHYAHKTPEALACDPDRALHNRAQELIRSGFSNAVAQSSEYKLGRLCEACEAPVAKNAAQAGSKINREVIAVPGTRADLVITYPDGTELIIEVTHTNDLSESTAAAYSQSGIRVLKIRPAWLRQDDGSYAVTSEPGLDGLTIDAGALAYDALNLDHPCLCALCLIKTAQPNCVRCPDCLHLTVAQDYEIHGCSYKRIHFKADIMSSEKTAKLNLLQELHGRRPLARARKEDRDF